ncbi:MAG: FAD-dependent oxidoreductase [Candidatus Hermodarchaeota archaeon]
MTDCSEYDLVDVAIIGAGPAGLSAALYTSRAGLKTALFGDPYSSQLAKAETVENFITWTKPSPGLEILEKMVTHATQWGAILIEKEIRHLITNGKMFVLSDEEGKRTCAYSILIASGTKHKQLGIKGEKEYTAKGIYYCTICDGPNYKNKPVAIIGVGTEALKAALRMSTIASSVTLVLTQKSSKEDSELIQELKSFGNVTIFENAKSLEVLGGEDDTVSGLLFQYNGDQKKIDINAIFAEMGLIPSSAFAAYLGVEMEGLFIKTNEQQETNIPGIFAAGNVTGGLARQAIISAGDGARAAISIIDYIKQLGVSSAKLRTIQWGRSQTKPKTDVSSGERQIIAKGALHEYVLADEGFKSSFDRYTPNIEVLSLFKNKLVKARMIIVSTRWCPDCRRGVPKMARIAEHLPGWEFIIEDRDKEGVREKYNARKIPTFIIQDENGKELGRIIEKPKFTSFEEDLHRIVEGSYATG